ncbi:hypothetical protein SLEP1_g17397 [Rubroshorea leprosula]|uniref:Yippee domain-containing protein n=1 Tax=Rubroshorea leprosula TaxID=152421 RepID=A0AAV5J4L0_9ROSI|nr:hypothetical protein SLEP1_g17397 [Rubroshorea leprosula]
MFKLQIPKIIGRGKAVHWQLCFVVLTAVTKHWALEFGGTLRNEYCANCLSHLGGEIVAMKTPNPPYEEENSLLML